MNTHEEVNLHVEQNYENAFNSSAKKDLKGVWPIAKPIIELLAKFPLIPVKWRNVLEGLVITIDFEIEKSSEG